jgi:hypothetical protein
MELVPQLLAIGRAINASFDVVRPLDTHSMVAAVGSLATERIILALGTVLEWCVQRHCYRRMVDASALLAAKAQSMERLVAWIARRATRL